MAENTVYIISSCLAYKYNQLSCKSWVENLKKVLFSVNAKALQYEQKSINYVNNIVFVMCMT